MASDGVHAGKVLKPASIEEFESLLNEIVGSKRLSASKMTRLTDIAVKTMERDTELVAILHRTHKSLPTANKVSSLYVFDSISRAARTHAIKHGHIGNLNPPTGNSATFLLKVEGILEDIFEDMMSADELKEKTKKILDIWVKGSTFPSPILTRLTEIVEGKGKEPEMKPKPSITADPRVVAPPSALAATSASPTTPATDPQATLLALLAKAANSTVLPEQTAVNTLQSAPSLESSQLLLLQQLALAQANNSTNAPLTLPGNSLVPPDPGPHQIHPQGSKPQQPNNSYHNNSNIDGASEQPKHYQENGYEDQYRSSRGGVRGRGRGYWRDHDSKGRWDNRDRHRDQDNNGDWSPSQRRTSRSRSPVRHGNRRDPRQHTPPRRDSWGKSSPIVDSTKDEFGRDIRSQSPARNNTPPTTTDPRRPLKQASRDEILQNSIPGPPSNHNRMSLTTSVAANTSSGAPSNASVVSSMNSTSSGLENFNPTTFDFTSPASWEALGKMWQITHGYIPATEELAQFVFTAQAALVDPTIQQQQHLPTQQNWSSNTSSRGWRGSGRGRGGFAQGRGGGYMNGNGAGNGYSEWENDGGSLNYDTDAVILGSGYANGAPGAVHEESEQNAGGSGGRMQKVGDKWVFVR